MIDSPEPPHAHRRATGPRWLEIVATLTLMTVSISSLVVAVHHGKVMERLVEENAKLVRASSWPAVQPLVSLSDLRGEERFEITLRNAGIGPAEVRSLQVYRENEPALNPRTLLDALGARDATQVTRTSGLVLAAKDSVSALTWRPGSLDRRAFAAFASKGAGQVTARTCYCSILDECWIASSGTRRPTPVEACPTGNFGTSW